MKSGPIARITCLIPNLPNEDIKYGNKYLSLRDYEALSLLVRSAVHEIDKAWITTTPNKKQENLRTQFPLEGERITNLKRLQGEVEEYNQFLSLILGDDDDYTEDIETDYEDK